MDMNFDPSFRISFCYMPWLTGKKMKNMGRIALAVAGAALLLLLLLFPVCLALAQTPADTPNNPFSSDPAAITAGKAIFDGTCAACHGCGRHRWPRACTQHR